MAWRRKREVEDPALAEQMPAGEPSRLTPVDVQQKVFRLAFRGYSERDVDEFLDAVTATLAALHEENKRLREQLADGGGAGTTMAAQQQADAIVRQAREEAARIASASPGAVAAGGDAPAPAPFLVRERAFLQRIASLVQDHARSLKEEARKLRQEPGVEAGVAAAGAAGAAGAAAAGAAGAAVVEPEAGEPSGTEPEPGTPEEPPEEEAAVTGPPEEGGPPAEEGPSEPQVMGGPPAMAGGGSAPPTPEDATVPWRAPDQQPVDIPDASETSTDDPLVAAWESAFAPEGGEPEAEEPGDESRVASERSRDEEEPSLRELFWGEE